MKAKMYGQKVKPQLPQDMQRRFWQRQLKRQRENTTRKPVAAQIVKEKEATE